MTKVKCGHLKDALGLWKKQRKEEKKEEGTRLSDRCARPYLYMYSTIQILYETGKGRWVKCFLCGKIWYTEVEYSKHLSMQR